MSKTLINGADGVANWSGVVNFHCFIFSDDRNDMPCSSLFLLSGNGVISLILESRPLIFVYLYTCTQSIQKQLSNTIYKIKYPEEYLTVNKVGSQKLVTRKSCFM